MNQKPHRKQQVDERLAGLFGEDGELVRKTIADAIHQALLDPEFEECVVETLQEAIDESDTTSASIWMCVILGETRCMNAIGPLIRVLSITDEMQQDVAVRALMKIGPRALEQILDLVMDEDTDAELALMGIRCLEGISLHEDRDLRDRIEDGLRHNLLLPTGERTALQRVEAAALALARMGSQDLKETIEHLIDAQPGGFNMFLQEALDIIEEHPEGLPCRAALPWESEFRWAFGDGLPGGDIERDDDVDDEEGGDDDGSLFPGGMFPGGVSLDEDSTRRW